MAVPSLVWGDAGVRAGALVRNEGEAQMQRQLLGGPFAEPAFGFGAGSFMNQGEMSLGLDGSLGRARAMSKDSNGSHHSGPGEIGMTAVYQRLIARVIAVVACVLIASVVAGMASWSWRQHKVAASPPATPIGEVRPIVAPPRGQWFQGLEDSIMILSPSMEPDEMQAAVDAVFAEMERDADGSEGSFHKGQFGVKRRAILLLPGDYGSLKIPVNWYTTVSGVGLNPSEVLIEGVSSTDSYPGSVRGSLENFWRSVEGVTLTEASTLWSISQGASLRRSIVQGDLWLSETDEQQGKDGDNKHYASGGFLADVEVKGTLHWGYQQQFFFRGSTMASVAYEPSGQSMVFVGVVGAPDYDTSKPRPLVSNIAHAPEVAEKPYLVHWENAWYVAVPPMVSQARGALSEEDRRRVSLISMDDVYVARPWDGPKTIEDGISEKKALLLTPGIYGLAAPIRITRPGFVVLGIGMPTLVATSGNSALVVSATDVRVAQVLLEAGSSTEYFDSSDPLLLWSGNGGIASDMFTRVGAFSYETAFHRVCEVTEVDVMVQVDGNHVVLDNMWLWHADHDDCTGKSKKPASDSCDSSTGLVVEGNDVIAYALSVEHTKADLLQWNGEGGQLFFYQAELPYRSNLNYGDQRHVGYRVAADVKGHICYGVGVYLVFKTFRMPAAVQLSATTIATNLFAWSISDDSLGWDYLYCLAAGNESRCDQGLCDGNFCYTLQAR